jgi:hypothetical protein
VSPSTIESDNEQHFFRFLSLLPFDNDLFNLDRHEAFFSGDLAKSTGTEQKVQTKQGPVLSFSLSLVAIVA